MDEQKRYEEIELPYFNEHIRPLLPPVVLDFHTHAWCADQWKTGRAVTNEPPDTKSTSLVSGLKGQQYMVTEIEYPASHLLRDGSRMFPGLDYRAVFFGQPTPAADIVRTNSHIAESARYHGLYPLIVVGRGLFPIDQLRRQIVEQGFLGYKVFLNWAGNDYGHVTVEEMLGPDEMALADELGLIVLLHVPRSRRLADPDVQRGVRDYAKKYPNARIVLAHCGRCYLYEEMKEAIDSIADLENVYFDTAMVMDPLTLALVFKKMDSRRVLFATDFPIAAMRGRRVRVMDHWVDVVLNGYPESDFRIAGDNIHASFMAWEIVLAIVQGGEMAGLSSDKICGVFAENGLALLDGVMGGRQKKEVENRWQPQADLSR